MKKITAISALSTLAVAALLASGPAAAQQSPAASSNALLSFQGAVTAATCTIATNSGASMMVTLPTVSTSVFTGQNTTAGKTPFTINLTGCTGATKAVPYFDYANPTGGTSNVNSSGRLTNITSGGSNVDLQISDTSGVTVGLNTPWASVGTLPVTTPQNVTTQGISSAGSATFNFTVQYYSLAATTTAGAVTSNVPIIMQYN